MEPAVITLTDDLPDWATYGTFVVLAAGTALALAVRGAHALGIGRGRAVAGFALAMAAGLVGARLLDVLLNGPAYAADPSRITAFTPQGFALYGGLAFGGAVAMLAARWWRVSAWRLADGAIPAVVAGIGLIRIGCFLAGCCFGTETDLPWAVRYPPGSPAWAGQVTTGSTGLFGLTGSVAPVHPTQLYELGAVLALGLVAHLLARRGVPQGVPALTFAAGFVLFRLANQAVRAPVPGASLPEWVAPALSISVVAAVGVLAAVRARGIPPEKIGAAPEGAAPLLSR